MRCISQNITHAGVAELADAPDLGSGGTPVQVQVLSPAPKKQISIWVSAFYYVYKLKVDRADHER